MFVCLYGLCGGWLNVSPADCTYVFEAHHHDYPKARKIIAKYEVDEAVALKDVRGRPKDTKLPFADTFEPTLLGDDAFYSGATPPFFFLPFVKCLGSSLVRLFS